jgi:hypothetical protein
MTLTAAHISPIIAIAAGHLDPDYAAVIELHRCHLPHRGRIYRAERHTISVH